MSGPSPAAHRAHGRQVARIARLMLLDPTAVHGLDDVPVDDLQLLHDQISESYFAPGRELLTKVAGLARVLPATVAGRFAERFLPPTQGARSAEMLEPAKARDLCGKVSVPYLADLALALDPARAAPILRAIPAARVAEVAAELFARREYGAVAELAGNVTQDSLAAALGVADGRDLLMVLPLLDWSDDLVAVVDRVPAAEFDALLVALVDGQRWDDGADVFAHLTDAARGRWREAAGRLSGPRRAVLDSAADAGYVIG